MALVRKITEKVAVPHEPGQEFVLRKLTYKQLEAASDKRSDVGLQKMRQMGGELVAALQGVKRTDGQKPDVLRGYDVETLLRFGVANWSYEEPFTQEGLDDLDSKTARWAATELLRISGVLDDEAATEKND